MPQSPRITLQVLLANTNYRAQIQADILPFKGILLGIFFMVAGSSFDLDLAVREWPTVATGAAALVALKSATLLAATRVPRWLEPKRLCPADGIRLALLLSGGGEFAFVVLALAEKLKRKQQRTVFVACPQNMHRQVVRLLCSPSLSLSR